MKKFALLFSSLLILPLAGCGGSDAPRGEPIDPDYQIVFNKDTHLVDGEITSRIGVHFHFDEKAVIEDSPTGFITLGAYGGIYLQNYVPGIKELYVKATYEGGYITEGGYAIGISSTPNSFESYLISQTTGGMFVTSDKPYISLINRGSKDLIIEELKFKYEEDTSEELLKEMIQVEDKSMKLDLSNPIKPYDYFPLDESKIPSNRIVKKIGPEEYTLPGEYTFGYEVHNNLGKDGVGKLLYSSTATLKISGTVDNKHLAIFHLEDKDVLIPVNDGEKVNPTLKEDISTYDWNNVINDFSTPLTSDRHFYPNYNVIGLPTNKDGDGCHITHSKYSGLTGKVDMPDPVMKEGYKFGGWFLDHACTQVFDMEARHSGNLTLYAKCFETTDNFRKVYYYDYDNSILNRVDYINEDEDASISLPKFSNIGTKLEDTTVSQTKGYEIRMGANRLGVLRPEGKYPFTPEDETYPGDKLEYKTVKDNFGDIKLCVIRLEVYSYPEEGVLRFFTDLEENIVSSGLPQEEFKSEGDRILAARYIDHDPDWHYTYNTYYDPVRGDTYLITDEVNGYIIDGGLYTSISSYGYGNKYREHSKPLEGILRHDSVVRVSRRAFFNRYGLKGTYFPINAREFDLEAYSSTFFNDYLLLPTSLKKIGKRCFVNSGNIHHVFLPVSLEQVGEGAFSKAEFDEKTNEFKNVQVRSEEEKIMFYYEGSEEQFKRLDPKTQLEITNNASTIIYNVKYNPCYSK